MRGSWLASPRGYRRAWLGADVLAGVVIWALLVPESFACAQIAGVPPESGLYAMIPALLCYALLGRTNHVPVGPISVTAALSAAIVAPHVSGGGRFLALSAALALVAGCAGVLAGLARLGFAAALIAPPVLRGFTVGLVLTVLIGQLPTLLGLPDIVGGTWARCAWIAAHLHDIAWPSALFGIVALLAVLVGRRRFPTLPIAFAVVVAAVAVSRLWSFDTHGGQVVDPIDRGLPRPGWPSGIGTLDLLGLVGPALAVVVVGLAEGVHGAEAALPQRHREVDPNLELVGLGLANLGSGALSGMVVGGHAPTAAPTGARTRLGVLVAAVLAVITVLLPGGLFERLPRPVLAAVAMAV
ncbi:SulP family inorganic anion transporter, partial [Nocardia sp. NPDC004722]